MKPSFLLFILLVGAASWGAAQGVGDRAKKALGGDVSAQISLGESYRLGLGVDQNYAEARRFYKLAAAQGAPQAQFALAEMNRFGEGAAPDYPEAARLYKLAAAQGLPEAQFDTTIACSLSFGHKAASPIGRGQFYLLVSWE